MKAGWFFCFSDYDPITMELQPLWPGGFTPTTLNYTLYDVRRLDSGVAPADHVHQVLGSAALPNHVVDDGHEHDVQYFGANWHQVYRGGGVSHDHPFQSGGVGDVRFLPDFFAIWVSADDAEFDTLVADSQWYLIGEAAVTFDAPTNTYLFGLIDNTTFTAPERTAWETRFRVALGRDLPVEITNPRRLVSWFCPRAAPNMYDWWSEALFRPTSRPA